MFRKFDKMYRLQIPQFQVPAKKVCLTGPEAKELLDGTVLVEEKLDGGNTGVVRDSSDNGFRLQKRGDFILTNEHPQYGFLTAWAAGAFDRINKLPIGTVVYLENLYAKHNIHYKTLPHYLFVIDVWNGSEYVDVDEKRRVADVLRLPVPPVVYNGVLPSGKAAYVRLHKMISKSAFYDGPMEGVVVKNHSKQMRAKIVRPEFMKEIEESDHWRNKPVTKNGLSVGVEILA